MSGQATIEELLERNNRALERNNRALERVDQAFGELRAFIGDMTAALHGVVREQVLAREVLLDLRKDSKAHSQALFQMLDRLENGKGGSAN